MSEHKSPPRCEKCDRTGYLTPGEDGRWFCQSCHYDTRIAKEARP